MPSSPIDGEWKGNNFKTLWDHGGPPRSFKVTFNLDPRYTTPGRVVMSGSIVGTGVSCGQPFYVRNGRFDLQKVTFEMIFNDHPPEVFEGKITGRKQADNEFFMSGIHGKVKVHPDWLMEKSSQVKTQYGRYYATVSLKK